MTFLSVALSLLLSSTLVHALPSKRQDVSQVITKCTIPNTVALTFDDGPFSYTDDVAKTLTAAGANGTFFFNGNNLGCIYNSDNVQRVKNAFAMGHQVASHTWSHSDLAKLSLDEVSSQFSRMDEAFQRILGVTPTFMRPPYGSYNPQVQQVAAAHKQLVTIWDFDSGDSSGHTPQQIQADYDNIANQHPPTILTLNHEINEASAHQVLPHAISVLKAKGYRLVTVADCLGLPAYQNVGTPQTGPFSC